jgi:hypothetical protein
MNFFIKTPPEFCRKRAASGKKYKKKKPARRRAKREVARLRLWFATRLKQMSGAGLWLQAVRPEIAVTGARRATYIAVDVLR